MLISADVLSQPSGVIGSSSGKGRKVATIVWCIWKHMIYRGWCEWEERAKVASLAVQLEL